LQNHILGFLLAVYLDADNIARFECMRHAVVLCRYSEEDNIAPCRIDG
jgi:hypothetical protein